MLLMGSQASVQRGDLPAWADPRLTDFDIVGSAEEFEALHDTARAVYPLAVGHVRPNQRRALRIPLGDDPAHRLLIDWVDDTVASSQLLTTLPDNTDGTVFGLPCQVISAVTELAIKRAILPYQADPTKTLRWIAHWEAVVDDQPVGPELQAFVDQLVAEYEALRTPA